MAKWAKYIPKKNNFFFIILAIIFFIYTVTASLFYSLFYFKILFCVREIMKEREGERE
jgi:hypothetical protein